jgi:hypothetical protein
VKNVHFDTKQEDVKEWRNDVTGEYKKELRFDTKLEAVKELHKDGKGEYGKNMHFDTKQDGANELHDKAKGEDAEERHFDTTLENVKVLKGRHFYEKGLSEKQGEPNNEVDARAEHAMALSTTWSRVTLHSLKRDRQLRGMMGCMLARMRDMTVVNTGKDD